MSDSHSIDRSFFIGKVKIPHRLILAPMCGITHKPFRSICRDFGAGMMVTQMVSAKALTMSDQKSRKLLSYDLAERPVCFQLFGNNADTLAEAAKIAQDMGPDLIDLNMGCPAKKIVNDGGGSALLRDKNQARDIFEKMRAVLTVPFTVKMRAGYDSHGASLEIAQLAQECGVDAIALHARTKAQGYKGSADWNLIKEFKQALSIPVIGNGDVESVDDVNRMLEQTGCDAVMTGRHAVNKPWFFKSYNENREWEPDILDMKNLLFTQYERYFEFFGESSGIKQMRKHLCAYTKGLRGGAKFRNTMLNIDNWTLLKPAVEAYFEDAYREEGFVTANADQP